MLVGDPAQLSEVGAGGLFTVLARHPNTITLTDNRRQAEAWERRALADLRAGDPRPRSPPTPTTAGSTSRRPTRSPTRSSRTTSATSTAPSNKSGPARWSRRRASGS